MQPPHGPADQEFIDPVVLSLLQHAEDIGALAIIVFGSVARGEADYQSDFDLLVVVEDFSARLRTIDRVTKQGGVGTSPLVLTRATLSNGLSTRSSFIAHLLDEGLLIFETAAWQELKLALQTIAADADLLAAEVRRRVKELEPLSHAERFSNSPVTAKSHVYGIARALVIARLLQLGIHEYSWRRAFDCYAEIYPEQRREIETLKALRPYYEVARGRFGAVLPRDAERYDDLSGLVASVQRLAA